MGTRRKNGRIDPTWARLLARLRMLADDYGEQVNPEAHSHAPVSPFAAMYTALSLLATLADLFQQGRREGWSSVMTFAPPSAEVGRAARVSVAIVEGPTVERSQPR